LVGPSYQEIADKYTEADLDKLATKIIEGGKGVWGEIPMTPHSGMSKENAQKMVKYILTLKK
jgi:cytochrome c